MRLSPVAASMVVCLFTPALALAQTLTASTALLDAARALEAQRAGDALAALEQVPIGSPLDDHRALLLGEAQLMLGDAARAEATLATIPKATREGPHPLWIEASRAWASAVERTRPLDAARRLRELPPDPIDLARAARLLRGAEAIAAQNDLLRDLPASPEALSLTGTIGAAKIHARLGADVAARLENLLDAHANDVALAEAELVLAAKSIDPALECRARFVEGKARRKLRHYKGALKALPRAVEACARANNAARKRSAQLLEIQVRGIRGELKAMTKNVDALLAEDPGHRFTDDALLLLAQLEERHGTPERARAAYARVLAIPSADQASDAAWGLAFEAIKRGAHAEAKPLLEAAVAAEGQEPVDRARARDWLARIGDPKDCAAYQSAAIADGLGFFTWLVLSRVDASCRKRIEAELSRRLESEEPELAELMRADKPSVVGSPAYARAMALARMSPERERDPGAKRLRSWARLELLSIAPPGDSPDRVAFALALDAVGAHKDAQDILRHPRTGVLGRPPSKTTRAAWEAAYSRPFLDEMLAAANEQKLDPLFLTALSREESTFDPEIVSWAGAVGLAQLMPGTAITAHFALTKKKIDLEQLTDPALNLRLGAWVLKDGLRKFGDLEPLALGAYNGGPGLVLKSLPKEETDFDLWSERVTVRETRRYIQRVIGTWGVYRFLYDRERPFVKLPATIKPSY